MGGGDGGEEKKQIRKQEREMKEETRGEYFLNTRCELAMKHSRKYHLARSFDTSTSFWSLTSESHIWNALLLLGMSHWVQKSALLPVKESYSYFQVHGTEILLQTINPQAVSEWISLIATASKCQDTRPQRRPNN